MRWVHAAAFQSKFGRHLKRHTDEGAPGGQSLNSVASDRGPSGAGGSVVGRG